MHSKRKMLKGLLLLSVVHVLYRSAVPCGRLHKLPHKPNAVSIGQRGASADAAQQAQDAERSAIAASLTCGVVFQQCLVRVSTS